VLYFFTALGMLPREPRLAEGAATFKGAEETGLAAALGAALAAGAAFLGAAGLAATWWLCYVVFILLICLLEHSTE
jgi:hypothetical protein